MNKARCNTRCNIGNIIKQHVVALVQMLTNDYPEYNFRLQTTKCLNTAVMLVLFFLGKKGLSLASACDTREVIRRNKIGIDKNATILNSLKLQLFSHREKKRTIYYILLSDGYFPTKQDSSTTVYFPGHVFVLEKIWHLKDKKHYFNFYQSYINQYDLKQHIANNKGLELSLEKTKQLIENLEYVLSSTTWDVESIKRWKDMTFVDTPELLNSKSHENFFLCFRKAKSDECLGRIKFYVGQKLKLLKSIPSDKCDDVYGNKELYEESSIALTNRKMKLDLERLLKKIQAQP
jgi:hypothetical protein